MNRVYVTGRLTKDPQPIDTKSGTLMARYTIAVDRIGEGTDFIDCAAFGKTAEFALNHLRKGIKILVEGRITTGSYVNREGKTVYTTSVTVDRHEFCESRKADAEDMSVFYN